MQYPISIAVSDAAIFLADLRLPGVWKAEGENLSLLFKADKKFGTPLNAIRCVELDADGNLLAGDSATSRVYRFEDGKPVPVTEHRIGTPMDIAINQAGDMFVSDLEIHRVVRIGKDGGKPEEVAQISGCRGLFIDKEDYLWVVSTTKDQLHRISPAGEREVIVKGRPFDFPHTVVVDENLTAYVCDGFAKTIWKIPKDGEPAAWAKEESFVNPVGMAIQGDKILVVDPRANGVFQIDAAGNVTRVELKFAAG